MPDMIFKELSYHLEAQHDLFREKVANAEFRDRSKYLLMGIGGSTLFNYLTDAAHYSLSTVEVGSGTVLLGFAIGLQSAYQARKYGDKALVVALMQETASNSICLEPPQWAQQELAAAPDLKTEEFREQIIQNDIVQLIETNDEQRY